MITDVLIKELEEVFGTRLVEFVETWDETCRLQGSLRVIQWIKDRQQDYKEDTLASTTKESPVTVDHMVPEPRIIGKTVRNAQFFNDN